MGDFPFIAVIVTYQANKQPQYIGTFAQKDGAICRHQIFSIFLFAYFFFALTDQCLSVTDVSLRRKRPEFCGTRLTSLFTA